MLLKYMKKLILTALTGLFLTSMIACAAPDGGSLFDIESRGYKDSSRLVSTEWLVEKVKLDLFGNDNKLSNYIFN